MQFENNFNARTTKFSAYCYYLGFIIFNRMVVFLSFYLSLSIGSNFFQDIIQLTSQDDINVGIPNSMPQDNKSPNESSSDGADDKDSCHKVQSHKSHHFRSVLNTLKSGIDVGQGINVGPGKFGKKNKHRALNTHVLCSE